MRIEFCSVFNRRRKLQKQEFIHFCGEKEKVLLIQKRQSNIEQIRPYTHLRALYCRQVIQKHSKVLQCLQVFHGNHLYYFKMCLCVPVSTLLCVCVCLNPISFCKAHKIPFLFAQHIKNMLPQAKSLAADKIFYFFGIYLWKLER